MTSSWRASWFAFAFAAGGSLLQACGDTSTSVAPVSFRTAAAATTPVVPASASGGVRAIAPDPPGVLKSVFYLLRSYDPLTDQNVDMTNLYRVLETADGANELLVECAPGEATPIAPPFPLGIEDTYTCAVNNHKDEPGGASAAAVRDDGDARHALFTYRTNDGNSTALGVVQGHVDKVGGELQIEMATVVRYPVVGPTHGLGFGLRTSLAGNAVSHDFTLRALVRNVEEGTAANTTSIVGVGNSQAPGSWFLLRITASGQNTVDGRYYCVGAGADQAVLTAFDPAGTAAPAPECAALRAQVDALTPFVRADAPAELAQFTGSDIYLPL